MFDDGYDDYKEIVVEVDASMDKCTVTITMTSDEPITRGDMIRALDQYIDETEREPGETIQ